MNLRLDADSVRVRVSLVEARTLLLEGVLAESMAFPGRRIELRILASPELTALESFSDGEGNIALRLPLTWLRKLLQEAEEFSQSRIEPSIEGVSEPHPVRMFFEIDLFSLKKKRRES